MDERLLQALSDIGVGLEELVKALDDKKKARTDTATAIKGGDFSKELKEISVSIKSIKKDTQEILKQQKTILNLQKQKEAQKTEGIETDPKKESQIKKGVGVILLIALAVLAIGLAFKLVGKIDFLSVIGLALAITIISIAFEKIAKLNLNLKQVGIAALALVAMAAAITVSSWILGLVKPIGFTQFLTATFIAITFAFIGMKLEKIFIGIAAFDKLRISPIKVVISLVAIATAITMSSWIFKLITPISFPKALTAILIAATFAVIGFSLDKIAIGVVAFSKFKIKTKDLVKSLLGIALAITASSWIMKLIAPVSFAQGLTAILISATFMIISFNLDKIAAGVIAFVKTKVKATDLLLTLVGVAAAITVSSWVLKMIVPLGFTQFLTALGITILFAIMSYFFEKLAAGIVAIEKVLGKNKIYLIPLTLLAIATAIMLSSLVLSLAAPIGFVELLKILVLSVVLAIAVVVLGVVALILAKIGLGNITKGSAAIVILATAIMISSQLLSRGKYSKYPGLMWTLLSGISILAFGLVAWILTKLGGVGTFIKGAIAIGIIAATIMASSLILSLGKYDNYPSLDWALGVSLSLGAFGLGAVLLGTQVFNPFFYAGLGEILVVAGTIVAASYILNEGQYEKYPSASWIAGVGASMTAFGIAAVVLGLQVFNPLFAIGLAAIVGVAKTINLVDNVFTRGEFKRYPSNKWIMGAGMSINYFAKMISPIAKILGLVILATPAVMLIAKMIGTLDATFQRGVFKKFPGKTWTKGTTSAILEFAKILPGLGLLLPLIILGSLSALAISGTIWSVDKILSRGKYEKYPNEKWSKSTGRTIEYFSSLMVTTGLKGMLSGLLSLFSSKSPLESIAEEIVKVDTILSKGQFKKYPPVDYVSNVGKNLVAFVKLSKALSASYGVTGMLKSALGMDPISQTTAGMMKMAKGFDALSRSLTRFSSVLAGLNVSKMNAINRLSGNMAILSAMDSVMFDRMLRTLENRGSVFAKLADVKSEGGGVSTVGVKTGAMGKKGGDEKVGKYGNSQQQLDKVIELLTALNASTSQLDEYLTMKGVPKRSILDPEDL